MSFQSKAKIALLKEIPDSFVDPLTQLKPSNEVELSALLCLYHCMDEVDWSNVPLYDVENNLTLKFANHIVSNEDHLQCEYPLFADEQQYKVWGQMPVDILAFSKHKSKITVIENKIGSTFTSGGGDPVTGQLARQIEFLLQSKPKNKYFALLSSKTFFDKHWYCKELNNTLKHKECTDQISSYLIHWEDIFSSLEKI